MESVLITRQSSTEQVASSVSMQQQCCPLYREQTGERKTICINTLLKINLNPLVPDLKSWCNLQNPRFKLQALIFSCELLPHPQKNGCARMAIIGRYICCAISKLNQAPCDAVYALVGDKRLISNN
jgi:hypothetical protein